MLVACFSAAAAARTLPLPNSCKHPRGSLASRPPLSALFVTIPLVYAHVHVAFYATLRRYRSFRPNNAWSPRQSRSAGGAERDLGEGALVTVPYGKPSGPYAAPYTYEAHGPVMGSTYGDGATITQVCTSYLLPPTSYLLVPTSYLLLLTVMARRSRSTGGRVARLKATPPPTRDRWEAGV